MRPKRVRALDSATSTPMMARHKGGLMACMKRGVKKTVKKAVKKAPAKKAKKVAKKK
jgi:hypothetical protein